MFSRSALIGLLIVVAAAVSAPVASATISPGLTLEQSGGTAAGSSVATGFDINSHATIADSLETLTVSLPAGLLVNLNQNNGSCLASAAPTPLCEIARGTINGATGTPVNLYLVTPPTPSGIVQNLKASSQPLNAAGVDLVIQGGATISGALTLTSSPSVALTLSFASIPLASHVKELQLMFASMRLPTNCTTVESLAVQASSWQGSSGTAAAPLAVSGCSSLPYNPTISAKVTKENAGAMVEVQFTQGAGEAASNSLEFGEPPGVKLNKVLAPCFNGETCTVGTVAASSPLLPSTALSSGMLTLAGSINKGNPSQAISGSLTMSFPPPFEFSVAGPIDIAEKMLSFSGLPDLPLSTLTFTFTGIPAGPAFTTECEPGTIAATVLSQDGNPAARISGPVTNVGCPPPSARPKVSGSLGGLAAGKPVLHVSATRGSGAANIASLQVSLPGGLSFSRHAIATHRSCKRAHGHNKCTTAYSVKGFSLHGAGLASARLQGSALLVTFSHAVASASLTARGPLLAESRALRQKAKRHQTKGVAASVRVTDAKGTGTTVSVP
jgi:hypothetical protein